MNGPHQPRHDANNGTSTRFFNRLLFGVTFAFCSTSLLQSDRLLRSWFPSDDHLSRMAAVLMRDFTQSYDGSSKIQEAVSIGTPPVIVRDAEKERHPEELLHDDRISYAKVIVWNEKSHLKAFMTTYFQQKNLVCDLVPSSPGDATVGPYLLNISFGCNDLFYNSGLGSGNFVAGFYAIRLAAKAMGMKGRRLDVQIACPDANQEQRELILPWLTGFFPSSVPGNTRLPSSVLKGACNNIDSCPIGYMYPDVQIELRRMALRMVGIPPPLHSTHDKVMSWLAGTSDPQQSSAYRLQLPTLNLEQLRNQSPLYPNVELDDVIIHFRCGDLMNSDHPRFAFLSFPALASPIQPQVKSIGIVTQPYDEKVGENVQSRTWDNTAEKRRRCRIVVTDFVRYLSELFPSARVSVHNSPHDTIALTYARMILANQTIAGISTFGVFPSIASFGTGYIRKPDDQSPTNGWLLHPPLNTLVKSLELMEEPNILMVRQVKKMWSEENGEEHILNWFRGGGSGGSTTDH